MGGVRNNMGALFAVLNRNKRAIVLDMQRADARTIFFKLVKSADVVVQNFRPGAMTRMGIDYPMLKTANEAIIYASISGFGADGPYAARKVYDPIIQSVTGFVDAQTPAAVDAPELVRNILCDKATSLTAAQAITAALFARERGRGGQSIDIAMVDVGLSFLWPDGMWNDTFLGGGVRPMPSLRDIYRVTKTLDGYVTFLTVSDSEWQGMCSAIGRDELARDEKFIDVVNRIKNISELIAILNMEVAKWKTDDICARLDAAEVPFAKINKVGEVHADPQIVHRGSVVELDDQAYGRMRMPRPPARFSTTPSAIRMRAPGYGEHTDEVLTELGYARHAIEALRADGSVS
jgi:crotonobetainyl-CoA:carnitine CoA-transferase CaiB-like acyl-CoA transferase